MADAMKFLKPRQKELIVRDPSTFIPLPAKGALIEWTGRAGTYWRRRVRVGDCVEVKQEIKRRKGGSE